MPDMPTVHKLRMLQDLLHEILSSPLICARCGQEIAEEWLGDTGPSRPTGESAPVGTRALNDSIRQQIGAGTYAPGTRPGPVRSRFRPGGARPPQPPEGD
jgi:hypothetical protein